MTDARLVYVTCKDKAEAEKIARAVVRDRLAACANIFAPHSSIYEWNGDIQHEDEAAMILKTSAARLQELEEMVIALHSYDNPCFVVIDVADGAAPFLEWIKEQTKIGV